MKRREFFQSLGLLAIFPKTLAKPKQSPPNRTYSKEALELMLAEFRRDLYKAYYVDGVAQTFKDSYQ